MAIKKYFVKEGDIYGHWTVIEVNARHYANGSYVHKCQCTCGHISYKSGNRLHLQKGKCTKCTAHDYCVEKNTTHGESKTRLYKIWKGMRKRCFNSSSNTYHAYGERGITVCTEWDDFVVFRDWALTNGYKNNLTIERIDVNGNYCPKNCTWIPKNEQNKNMRQTIWISLFGETKCLGDWLKDPRCSISTYPSFYKRKKNGMTDEEALLTKPWQKRKGTNE